MKKRLLAVIIATAMTLSLASCGLKTDETGSASPDTSVSESQTSTETETESSTSLETVIEPDQPEYEEDIFNFFTVLQDFYSMTWLGIEPLHDEFYQPQGETMWMSDDEKAAIGCYFDDIDGDGSVEMLIGRGDSIYAVCGMAGDGPFVYLGAGYRSMMTIYENGLIVYEGSSGASSYSYAYYYIEGQELALKDFFYTDYNVETDQVYCYHNTTGDWDDNPDDVITEDEFNIMTDVGLEARNYSDEWINLSEYDAGLSYVCINGVTIEDLTETDVTWSFTEAVVKGDHIFAEHDEVIQTLQFTSDEKVSFFRSDESGEVWSRDNDCDYNTGLSNHVYAELKMTDTTYQSICVVGFTADGQLMVQRTFYDFEKGESYIANEYYSKSWG